MDSVFINCPYDQNYVEFFKFAIYFCCYLGLEPIFASENESSIKRMDAILNDIKKSKFSIHDISRNETGLSPRFNMPFELGIDYCYKEVNNPEKSLLILSKEDYDSDKVLSDSRCLEVKYHENDINIFADSIRSFFVTNLKLKNFPSSKIILLKYKSTFDAWLHQNCELQGIEDVGEIKPSEFKLKSISYFEMFPNLVHNDSLTVVDSENLL